MLTSVGAELRKTPHGRRIFWTLASSPLVAILGAVFMLAALLGANHNAPANPAPACGAPDLQAQLVAAGAPAPAQNATAATSTATPTPATTTKYEPYYGPYENPNPSIVRIAWELLEQREAPAIVRNAMLQMGFTESNFHNIANSNVPPSLLLSRDHTTGYYEDGIAADNHSSGWVQQQTSADGSDTFGWGTVEQTMDPVHAGSIFLDRAMALAPGFDGDASDLAQAVQRSGTPDGSNYRRQATKTTELIAQLEAGTYTGGPIVAASTAPAPCPAAQSVDGYLPVGPQNTDPTSDRLTVHTRALQQLIEQQYGDRIYGIGGWRESSESGAPDHPDGRALDVMVAPYGERADAEHNTTALAIIGWLKANADEFYIEGLIYEQRYWSPGQTEWSPMADRGSNTANHYDHIHIVQEKNPTPPPQTAIQAVSAVSPAGIALPLAREVIGTPDELDDPHHDTPGWDFGVPENTTAFAVVGGTVERAGYGSGFGDHAVYVRDGTGFLWRYGHGNAHLVNEGQTIGPGTPIIRTGNQGISTGPHIHIDILNRSGQLVCPQPILTAAWNGTAPPPTTSLPTGGCSY